MSARSVEIASSILKRNKQVKCMSEINGIAFLCNLFDLFSKIKKNKTMKELYFSVLRTGHVGIWNHLT